MAQVYGQVESLTRVLRGLAQVGHKGLSRLDQVLQLRTEVEEAYGLLEELEVFHLPALFLYAQGDCVGPVHAPLHLEAVEQAIRALL